MSIFRLIKQQKNSNRRVALLKTQRGVIKTPFFMPIATKGAVKGLTPEDLKDLGAQIVLGNAYHLWLRPGTEIIKKSRLRPRLRQDSGEQEGFGGQAGDLHSFMNWPGPILTDSGGYQVFSLGEKIRSAGRLKKTPSAICGNTNFGDSRGSCLAVSSNKEQQKLGDGCDTFFSPTNLAQDDYRPEHFKKELTSQGSGFVKITDEGVEFRDPIDGKKYFLTPEKSIAIQLALGSDIIMALDECPPAFVKTSAGKPYPVSREQVERAVKRTTDWARRCKIYFEKKTKSSPTLLYQKEGGELNSSLSRKGRLEGILRPLLFGIVQGGIYKDLRERSAKELLAIGFDGYAIGGVAVGEPRRYLSKVLDAVMPLLPEDKPRYLMGLGKPEEIVNAVNAGIDMFDCVIPTREARHGRLYAYSSTKSRLGGTRGEVSSRLAPLARTIKADFYKTLQITNSKFAKDFSAIDKNCSCYTCQNYSRAYLHHLFKVGEPLSLRLATIHN